MSNFYRLFHKSLNPLSHFSFPSTPQKNRHLIPRMPIKQKPMHAQQIKPINHNRRQQINPLQIPPHDPIRPRRHQRPILHQRPHPRQHSHIPIPVILPMRFPPPTAPDPSQFRTLDVIDGSLQKGKRHDDLHVLHRQGISTPRPDPQADETQQQTGKCEKQAVVFKQMRPRPKDQRSRQGSQKRLRGESEIIHKANNIAEFLRQSEAAFPKLPAAEEDRDAAGAPAQLLAEERGGRVGRHAARQDQGDILHRPAVRRDIDTRMDIFRAIDGDGAADGFQRQASIDGVAADADRGAPSVATGLHDAEHVFLNGSRALFRPGLIASGIAEKLRRLQDGPAGVVEQVWDRIQEEVRAGAEIGVEDDEEFG